VSAWALTACWQGSSIKQEIWFEATGGRGAQQKQLLSDTMAALLAAEVTSRAPRPKRSVQPKVSKFGSPPS
jgi:hypothetical protein